MLHVVRWLSVMLLAMGPLSDAQRTVLQDTAARGPAWDTAGLYALLQNTTASADHATTNAPNYQTLLNHPDTHQGQRFHFEAQFAARETLHPARPGPWGETLQRWDLYLPGQPTQVLVVYLPNPRGDPLPTPRRNQRIQFDARFYKVWTHPARSGGTMAYPAFVAGRPKLMPASSNDPHTGTAIGLLILAVLAGLFILWRLRRQRPAPARPRRPRHARPSEPEQTLPPDPADALAALDRRGKGNDE